MAGGASVIPCVCWEWQRDDGGYSPYPPEVSAQIETAYATYYHHSSCDSVVLTGSYGGYVINFSKNVQRNTTSGYERVIRRVSVNLPSSPSFNAYWTWRENRSSFVLYNLEASVDIELSYLRCDATLNLAHCTNRLPYTIDFSTMEQTRHGYGTKRKIQRYPLSTGTLQSHLAVSTSSSSTATATTSPSGGVTSHTPAVLLSGTSNTGGTSALPNPFGQASLKSSGGFGTHTGTYSSVPTSFGISTGGVGLGHTFSSGTASGSSGLATNFSIGYASSPPKTRRSRNKSKATASSSLSSCSATGSGRGKRRGKRGEDKGIVVGGGGSSEVTKEDTEVAMYAKKVRKKIKNADEEPCPICMNKLTEHSGFEEDDHPLLTPSSNLPINVYKLKKCAHMLHRACLLMYMKNSSQSGFQCPTCKKSYGVKTGDMPDGTMTTRTLGTSLAGHEGYRTIEITYNFSPGVYKGKRYRANAFPRTCYLPDSPKGQKVLKLLRVAWERKLTFTVGTSVTSGATDTVVWNEIHHKTSTNNYNGHGYPDPTYLDRVLLELAAQGVEDEEDGQDGGKEEEVSSEEDDEEEEEGGDDEETVKSKDGKGHSASNVIDLGVSDSDDSDL